MTDLRNLASVVLAMLEADKIPDARVHLRAYLAAPSEGMKPGLPTVEQLAQRMAYQHPDMGPEERQRQWEKIPVDNPWRKQWLDTANLVLEFIQSALSPGRSGEPSVPQTSAEQYIGSDEERVVLERKALGDFAAPQPVSGDAPKVEEIARQLNHKFGFHSSRVLTYEGALEFLRPYFPPASQTPNACHSVETFVDNFLRGNLWLSAEHEAEKRDAIAVLLKNYANHLLATPASTARTDGPERNKMIVEIFQDDGGTWRGDIKPISATNRGGDTSDDTLDGLMAKLTRMTPRVFAAPGSVPQAPDSPNKPPCPNCGCNHFRGENTLCNDGVPQAEPPKEEKL